jgi:hypothetical protein
MSFVEKRFTAIFMIMIVIIVSATAAQAQSFSDIAGDFPQISMSSAAWGDYDNDGDLDLLLEGFSSRTGDMTILYRNDGNGAFAEITTGITDVNGGTVDWGDYDNDGDLDILIIGDNNALGSNKVYRNDGNGIFTDIQAATVPLFNGNSYWKDFDNDGDLDFAITGNSYPRNTISLLYRNDGHDTFTEIDAGLMPLWRGSLDWGDYDNDGDADLLLTGTNLLSVHRTRLYRNDGGGSFSDTQLPFFNVTDGQAVWGDYDQDGDLDIILNGSDSFFIGVVSKLYRNNGDGSFTDMQATIVGAGEGGAVSWGDYDNDGDLDLIMIGSEFGGTVLYRYDGNNAFTADTSSIQDGCCGSIDWGDYDNDRDLDLFISGLGFHPSRIYRNNISAVNNPPTRPQTLPTEIQGNQARLRWGRASDDLTAAAGLTYNIRVGTTPGGIDIVSPMADITTGFRKIVGIGNAFEDTAWVIKNLTPGTYYWAVQSIDNCFQGSLFSHEDSFVIGTLSTPENQEHLPGRMMLSGNYPNPFNGKTIIKYNLPKESSVQLDIYNITGALIQSSHFQSQPAGENQFSWDASNAPSGVYYYKIQAGDSKAIGKMVFVK